MTGLVLWPTSDARRSDAITLEYSYMRFDDVVVGSDGHYDFAKVESLLDAIAARKHQAVLRFYYVYPGKQTTVPAFIKARTDYHETQGLSENQPTGFPDWSNQALKDFTIDFYAQLAKRYDRDPRIAFLQVGFGLWAEYHIYDGPFELGKTFPDKAYQATIAHAMAEHFRETPWMISVDAADPKATPFKDDASLLALPFGTFDDSFLCKQHAKENEANWNTLGRDRWQRSPAGGEFSYYTKWDQRHALDPTGPHGESFESAAARFHLSFMIANDQPGYVTPERLRAAGMSTGYRFRVTACTSDQMNTHLTVTNVGIAPLYHDAYFAVDQTRSTTSLKGLLPGKAIDVVVDAPATDGRSIHIESDRLVAGQEIEFETMP